MLISTTLESDRVPPKVITITSNYSDVKDFDGSSHTHIYNAIQTHAHTHIYII